MRPFTIYSYNGENTQAVANGVQLTDGRFVVDGSPTSIYDNVESIVNAYKNTADMTLVWDDQNIRKKLSSRILPICDEIKDVLQDENVDDDSATAIVYRLVQALPQLVR